MASDEERIALYIDNQNLALGARVELRSDRFDFKPVGVALAERGRGVVRRADADWSYFGDGGRDLTRHHVELIEMPQRMGASRTNAADIKMAVDALEMAFERAYLTTFVVCTGDSDFTPLVHKLRELNKRVIGVGLKASTSALLPPACDEFLFYERLEGVDIPRRDRKKKPRTPADEEAPPARTGDISELATLVTRTLSGLQSSAGGWGPPVMCTRFYGSKGTLWIEGGAVHVAERSGTRRLEVPADLVNPPPDPPPAELMETTYDHLHAAGFDLPPYTRLFGVMRDRILGKAVPDDPAPATFVDGLAGQ